MRARSSRRTRSRLIIVSLTVSSSTARFPPTSRWIRIAITVQRRSLLSMRSAASPSASSTGRPSRTSVNTRCSSLRIGSEISCATASSPCINEKPARSELASNVSVSGS